MLLFTLTISLLSGVLFGLAPALRLSRLDLHGSLKDASRGSAGASAVWGRGQNLRRLLVVAELALSVVLLIGAGLLIRSFAQLQNVSPGFNPANVLTLELTMTGRKYNDADARARDLPAALGAAARAARRDGGRRRDVAAAQPDVGVGPDHRRRTHAAGRARSSSTPTSAIVGGDYFRAMEIPLLKGRLFRRARHAHDAARRSIIDERMAQQLWPGEDPIGKRIRTGGFDVTPDTPWMTVVGVVGRVKQDALDADSRIALYLAHTQIPVARDERRACAARRDPASADRGGHAARSARSIPICRSTTCGRWRAGRRVAGASGASRCCC